MPLDQNPTLRDGWSPTWRVRYTGTVSDFWTFRPQIVDCFKIHAARQGLRMLAISDPVIDGDGFFVYGFGQKL